MFLDLYDIEEGLLKTVADKVSMALVPRVTERQFTRPINGTQELTQPNRALYYHFEKPRLLM
jgi:hypothetical protein